jgi:hypothetical protein
LHLALTLSKGQESRFSYAAEKGVNILQANGIEFRRNSIPDVKDAVCIVDKIRNLIFD